MKKAAPFLLRFPKSPTRLEAARDFDRGHSLASLLLPPAAVGSLPPCKNFSIRAAKYFAARLLYLRSEKTSRREVQRREVLFVGM